MSNRLAATMALLVVVGITLLVISGLFSQGGAGAPSHSTNAQFLERTAAGLAFLLAYLCWFFTRKQ